MAETASAVAGAFVAVAEALVMGVSFRSGRPGEWFGELVVQIRTADAETNQ
ncbi:hypothetical protein GCM10010302_02130 [Streptomyces polychromogenes]|uniref:TetR family transcriptional regulator n=1 Tax=Streptomyces polychromogenes TaxID=67342 RepID=A0ABP3EKX6_9ACTN